MAHDGGRMRHLSRPAVIFAVGLVLSCAGPPAAALGGGQQQGNPGAKTWNNGDTVEL